MCGIVGHLAFHEKDRVDKVWIDELNKKLVHRGPDEGGSFVDCDIALAMRRLSIIGLSDGTQPFSDPSGRYTIVFNGEIYNYRELRRELENQGYKTRTSSDTEILLQLYIQKKEKCLLDLNGMFAFAVWDRKEKNLFLARDPLGIKPLYYLARSDRFLFSSEMTPILESGMSRGKLDLESLSNYLAYWYVCEPKTMIEDIRQLPPGSYATLSARSELKIETYWEIPTKKERNISYRDACAELKELLVDSVALQTRADVPYGTFLSGGIDSGIVTALARKNDKQILSFAIGFEDARYSELPQARESARHLGVDLRSSVIASPDPQSLEKIIQSFDEPLGNASYVPTYYLAEFASQSVKVVLTGDGGDELFGGYPTYQVPYYADVFNSLPSVFQSFIRRGVQHLPTSHGRISFDYRLKQLMKGIDLPKDRGHYTWREIASLGQQKALFSSEIGPQISSYDPYSVSKSYFAESAEMQLANRLMHIDQKSFLLNDHLRKVDRMTMAHSLEARVPLLDRRIVEFAAELPSPHKVSLFKTKKILRSIATEYLPPSIVAGKKKGLTSPIAGWLFNELKEYCVDSLHGSLSSTLFKESEIDCLLKDHFSKRKDNSRLLWGLLTLNVWAKKYRGSIGV